MSNKTLWRIRTDGHQQINADVVKARRVQTTKLHQKTDNADALIVEQNDGTDIFKVDCATPTVTVGAPFSLGSSLTINSDSANALLVQKTSGADIFQVDAAANVVNVHGDFTVYGTSTEIKSTVTTITDPYIKLGEGNTADLVDLGWHAEYKDSVSKYAGIYRDASASDKTFVLYDGITVEPTTNIVDPTAYDNLAPLTLGSINIANSGTTGVSFTTDSDGKLTITPDGVLTTISSNLTVNNTIAADNVHVGGGVPTGIINSYNSAGIQYNIASIESYAHHFVARTATMLTMMGCDDANKCSYIQSTQSGVASKPLLLNPNGGNIGIGTTNVPAYPLTVNGACSASSYYGTLSTAVQPNITSVGTLTSLETSGNVGIGTTTPHNKLTVKADTGMGTNDELPGIVAAVPGIVLSNRDTTSSTFVHSGIFADTYRDVANPHYSGGIWFNRISEVSNFSSRSDIIFGSQGGVTGGYLPDEQMRVTTTGLGIGVSDPDSKLEVMSTSNQLRLSYNDSQSSSITTNSVGDTVISNTGTLLWAQTALYVEQSANTGATILGKTNIASGIGTIMIGDHENKQEGSSVMFRSNNDAAYGFTYAALIHADYQEAKVGGYRGGLNFYTNAGASSTDLVKRVSIANDGAVGITGNTTIIGNLESSSLNLGQTNNLSYYDSGTMTLTMGGIYIGSPTINIKWTRIGSIVMLFFPSYTNTTSSAGGSAAISFTAVDTDLIPTTTQHISGPTCQITGGKTGLGTLEISSSGTMDLRDNEEQLFPLDGSAQGFNYAGTCVYYLD